MGKKSLLLVFGLIFALSGCMFKTPDYVKLVTAPELKRIMEQGDIFLVDVHIPEQRHIKGTDLFIPFNEIEKNKDRFPKDKSTPIYVYCEGGPMGNAAAKSLHELGYTNLSNLEGGAEAWKKAGFEFE